MKTRIFIVLLFVNSLFSCKENIEKIPDNPGNNVKPQKEVVDYKARAKEIYDFVVSRYGISSGSYSGMYVENVPSQGETDGCSSLWYYDWFVSGASLMHSLGFEVGYVNAVDNYQKYWMDKSMIQNLGGYGPGTLGLDGTGKGDRYFDDNSIVGVNLVDAYIKTGETRFLERAGKIVAFIKTAYSDDLGGGIWWREPNRNPDSKLRDDLKPTCANGYAIYFLVKYYKVCPAGEKKDILKFATDLYIWAYDNLRDKDDNYITGIEASGIREYGKDPALTGVMMNSAIYLYEITGEQKYLDHAKRYADAAFDYFVKTRNGGLLLYPDTNPWSSVKLFRGYLDLLKYYPGVERYINVYIAYMDNAYKVARNAQGFFYEDFTGVSEGRSWMLLTQDAALESYAAIALYKEKKL